MNKKIISLICILMLSSGLNAMFPRRGGAGAGDDTGAGVLAPLSPESRRRAAEAARVARQVHANVSSQPSPDDGSGVLPHAAATAGTRERTRGSRTPGSSSTADSNPFVSCGSSGDESDSPLHRGLRGSDLTRGQLNIHQSLALAHLLPTTRFTVGTRECTDRQNADVRYALEQLARVERRVLGTETTQHMADLNLLVQTLSGLPESQQAVLRAIQGNPNDFREIYPAVINAITQKLASRDGDLTENELAQLSNLKDRMFETYGGELINSHKDHVFDAHEPEFTRRVQAQEPWARRHWRKFAAGSAALGFVARPYVEAGVRHTARVGVRVAFNQLMSKFTGTTADTPPTPPTK